MSRSEGLLAELQEPRATPLIMGVVNVTPDSFFPGSRTPDPVEAIAAGLKMAHDGAHILDVGGQSTRPGSDPVDEQTELRRVIPVVEALAERSGLPVSIDTDKAVVAEKALRAGARIVNDITALRRDPRMASVAAGAEAVILMHMQGDSPKTMQQAPSYRDAVAEVRAFLDERRGAFAAAGGDPKKVLVDPGIGFGKDLSHNLSLIRHIESLCSLAPVVLGVSRKSFLGRVLAAPGQDAAGLEDRLEGSLAVACWAALRGVRVLRVHDVGATSKALRTLEAILAAR